MPEPAPERAPARSSRTPVSSSTPAPTAASDDRDGAEPKLALFGGLRALKARNKPGQWLSRSAVLEANVTLREHLMGISCCLFRLYFKLLMKCPCSIRVYSIINQQCKTKAINYTQSFIVLYYNVLTSSGTIIAIIVTE